MIVVRRSGPVVTIGIDRPDRRNAISADGWAALAAAATSLGGSDAAAVILQSDVSGIFSAGADLAVLVTLIDDADARPGFRHGLSRAIEGLASLPMPTIAAVDGGCYGAAVALTLACDICVGGQGARFAITPAKLGIGYPAADVARLIGRVGRAHAARLLYTGDTIDVVEAARIGLVHEVRDRCRACRGWSRVAHRRKRGGVRPPAQANPLRSGRQCRGLRCDVLRCGGRRTACGVPGTRVMPDIIVGRAPLLFVCDHASAAVPEDIPLGIEPSSLDRHIAVDIGAGALTRSLAARFEASAVLGTVSRLVIDLHRAPDHPGLVPVESDGCRVPGNVDADRFARIARFYRPYHRAIARGIDDHRPTLVVAIHSFTPRLEYGEAGPRPWQVGILSNRDRRAADMALAWLRRSGIVTGDNQPYSGRDLNVTLNRHAEARGIPSLSIEVRNDLLRNDAQLHSMAAALSDMIESVRNSLASAGQITT